MAASESAVDVKGLEEALQGAAGVGAKVKAHRQELAVRRVIDGIGSTFRRLFFAIASTAGLVVAAALGFLGIFLVHQSFLWLSVRPAVAFERAKLILYGIEVTWNTLGRIGNAGTRLADAVIPSWNGWVHYVYEPTFYTIVDIVFLIFVKQPYRGVITEDQVPYAGFSCDEEYGERTLAWCGSYAYYRDALSNQDAFADSVVLGPQTARRLAEATGEAIVPVLPVEAFVAGMTGLSAAFLTLLGATSDVVFHVVYTVLSEMAVVLYELVFFVIKKVANLVLALARSGMLEKIIEFAIDVVLILLLEIFIPAIMATFDALLCVFDLFTPAGWDEQLKCIDRRCYSQDEWGGFEPDNLIVFTSVPIVWDRFVAIVESVVNSNTGRKYMGIDPDVSLDGVWGVDTIPALSAEGCAGCFRCKVPELRIVSILVMAIIGCSSQANIAHFMGGVEDECQTGGDWYELACGPAEAFSIKFPYIDEWATQHPAHLDHDPGLVEKYASQFALRARQLGELSANGAAAKAIADAWFLRDLDPALRDLGNGAARFYRRVCQEVHHHRRDTMKLPYYNAAGEAIFWGGPTFSELSEGSLARTAMQFLYESYASHARLQP